MNEQQYEHFKTEGALRNIVCLDDLADKSPRTLLFGYDVCRATIHVYIDPSDGLIHVLKYTSTGTVGSERFLVLSHTSGPHGGVARNEQFVPDKRLYPESCDLEFCRILRRYDVSLPFTRFDSAGLSRLDRFGGFSGYVATLASQRGVLVAALLPRQPKKFGDTRLSLQLLHEACIDAEAHYAVLDDQVWVAESDVSKVLKQVNAYHATISPAAMLDPAELEDIVRDRSICTWGYVPAGESHVGRFGAYTYSVDYPEGTVFADGVPDAIMYSGLDGVKALRSTYEGRPYLIVMAANCRTYVHINLFGCPNRFLEEMVKRHHLELVDEAR